MDIIEASNVEGIKLFHVVTCRQGHLFSQCCYSLDFEAPAALQGFLFVLTCPGRASPSSVVGALLPLGERTGDIYGLLPSSSLS